MSLNLVHLSKRRVAAIALAGTLALAAACSDGGAEPDGLPESSGSASAAAGPELSGPVVSLQAPAGFEVQDEKSRKDSTSLVVAASGSGDTVSLVTIPARGESPSLESQAETALEGLGAGFVIAESVTLDGVELWHIASEDTTAPAQDVYGAVHEGQSLRLTVRVSSEDDRDEVNQQVLASWSWTT